MNQNTAATILKRLLMRDSNNSRLFSAWISLCIGCTLLLTAVMIWSSFRDILHGRSSTDSLGSTFLTLSKSVSDASMSDKRSTLLSSADIAAVKQAPQVQDVGLLSPAAFKVSASLGSGDLKFYTLLFLEAAPDRFMDHMPESWKWQEGDVVIPIILSRDFLNMYNYIFAPSQGLPLLSENTVKALGFNLTVGEGSRETNFRAQVEGFSDRISSVLVPQSFIDYGNRAFGDGKGSQVSRLIVKVADPSDNGFVGFLEEQGFSTNAEQLRFNKMRSIVEAVSGATGVLALLLMGIGILVFILFIELTMAKAQESVRLLQLLGYSPRKLARFLTARYIPIMLSALILALVLAAALQYIASVKLARLQLSVSPLPGRLVWITAGISVLVLLLQIRRSVKKALTQT